VPGGLDNEGAGNLAKGLPGMGGPGAGELAGKDQDTGGRAPGTADGGLPQLGPMTREMPPMGGGHEAGHDAQQEVGPQAQPETGREADKDGKEPGRDAKKDGKPETKKDGRHGAKKPAMPGGRKTLDKDPQAKDEARPGGPGEPAREPGGREGQQGPGPGEEAREREGQGGGGGKVDIELVAREYAIHEQWAKLPSGRDDVVKEYGTGGPSLSDPASKGGATLSVEQRRELLNKAIGWGAASGGVQFTMGLAIRLGVNQAFKVMASKGMGKAIPFVGLAFSAWDLGTLLTQKNWLGKQGAFYKAFASGTPLSQRLKAIKQIIDLLASILGIAAGICGVIAVLTSWTVLGGVSFGALAAGLGLASAALGLVSTGLMAAASYFEYQEILQMEGSPEQILSSIAAFEGDVHNATEGLLMAPGRVKGITEDWRKIQRQTVVEREPPAEQPEIVKPGQATATAGGPGKPQSVIITPGMTNPPPQQQGPAPAGYRETKGGILVPGRSETATNSRGGLIVPGASAGPVERPQLVDPQGNRIRSARYVTTPGMDPTQAGHGTKGLGAELANSLRGRGQYRPETVNSPSSYGGLGRAYVKGKSPDPGRTVQAFAPGAMAGPILISDKVPVSAIADGELKTVRPDTKYVPGSDGGKLVRRATLAPLPDPPHDLHATTGRLKKAADLARKEEKASRAVEVGRKGDKDLGRHLSPEGASGKLDEAYRKQSETVAAQEAEVAKKDAKVKSSEDLLESQRQKDAETKGNADEGLQNESARRVGNVTSDSFLSTVVRGGAGVASVVGGAVNAVSNFFGGDDVIDTRAIENVRRLFTEAPKAREGHGRATGSSGEVGKAADQTAPAVQQTRTKVEEAKSKKESAKGKVAGYDAAGKKLKGTLAGDKAALSKDTAAYDAQRAEAKAAKETELAAYHSEMSSLQAWAVEHRSVRDANNALLDDMKAPPGRVELAPAAVAQVDGAKAAIAKARAGLEQAHGRMLQAVGAASARMQAGMGGRVADADAIRGRLMGQADNYKARLLEPQAKTLGSVEANLGSVAADRLPSMVAAATRVARAAEMVAADAVASFQRFADRVVQEAQQALEAETRRRQATAAP
jgi:hypothetical protein